MLSGDHENHRKDDGNDDRAQKSREIGIDVCDADFGENRGQRGEYRRQ